MEELINFNARKLYQKLFMSDDEFDMWLKRLGLLFTERACVCGGKMGLKRKPDERYPSWRCTRNSCRKERGYLVETWFEGTHLTLKEVFHLSYLWSRQTHDHDEIMFDMQRQDRSTISPTTITDFNNFFREVCVYHYPYFF